jgi:hypothetical protein
MSGDISRDGEPTRGGRTVGLLRRQKVVVELHSCARNRIRRPRPVPNSVVLRIDGASRVDMLCLASAIEILKSRAGMYGPGSGQEWR